MLRLSLPAFALSLFYGCLPPGGGGQACEDQSQCEPGATCLDGRCSCVPGQPLGCACPNGLPGTAMCTAQFVPGACACQGGDADASPGMGGEPGQGGAGGEPGQGGAGGEPGQGGAGGEPGQGGAGGEGGQGGAGGEGGQGGAGGEGGQGGAGGEPGECEEGMGTEVACGLNNRGVEWLICVGGQWEVDRACNDHDQCIDDEREEHECGLNGRGVQITFCEGGGWADLPCDDPDQCIDGQGEPMGEGCGPNESGMLVSLCVRGRFAEPECEGADECDDGAREEAECPEGSRTRACQGGSWGDWSDCRGVNVDCDGELFDGLCVGPVSESCVEEGSARAWCRDRGARLMTHAELLRVANAGWTVPSPGQYHTLAVDDYDPCADEGGVGNVAAPGWGGRPVGDHWNCGDDPSFCRRAMACIIDPV